MLIPVNDLIAAAKLQCSCKSPAEAREFYDKNENTVILDVREPHEAEKASLSMSINIPRGLLEMQVGKICETADVPILVHCGAGGRASLSAYTLQVIGYSNVHVIDAGFEEIQQTFA